MAPKKTVPSPPSIYTPSTPIDPEHEAKLKAEARAYALSGSSSSSSGTKRKSPPTSSLLTIRKPTKIITTPPAPATTVPTKPTSLSIHRPEKQHKPNPSPIPQIPPTTIASTIVTLPPSLPPSKVFEEDDDDYERFVKSLGLDDSFFVSLENDDEDFHLSDAEEDDDDDDDADADTELQGGNIYGKDAFAADQRKQTSETPLLSSPLSSSPIALPDFESDMYRDLEEELGSLLEEDMEAAVQSLMTSKKPSTPPTAKVATPSPKTPKASGKKQPAKAGVDTNSNESPATPLRDAARRGRKAQVTYQQSQQLRRLLTRHYQLLVQQGILAVRAAQMQKVHKEKSDFLSGETADDLTEILDGAVGMLQDLDQNRKDAIRNSIQLAVASKSGDSKSLSGRRSLLSKFTESSNNAQGPQEQTKDRRLTRAAFTKTLQEQGVSGAKRTAFDIPGLMKLKETFATIDKSVDGMKGSTNLLDVPNHVEACKMVLRQAGAHIDDVYIPGIRDLSENFCDAEEVFGKSFNLHCTEDQQMFLRRNRNLFTSGEDNLVLRGVNLYGEKQWILIADRYLPDRSVNIISQRYSKLCVMLYKAHGIDIDSKGNLEEPPKLESVDDIDEKRVTERGLKTAEPPAILNVHRWSLEEDLTLLKAVPLMGHMWAELGARLIPHRDRGHLRKRYQVLERRVKATVVRSSKGDTHTLKPSRWQGSARKTNVPAVPAKPTLVKSGTKSFVSRPPANKAPPRKPALSAPKVPPMSIEKAAASLAFLRPPRSIPPSASAPAKRTTTATAPVLKHPGKVIPTIKLLQTTRKSVTPKRPLQKLPVGKAFKPMEPSQVEMHLNSEPSFSRTAFEQLVNGTSDEWSQMSRMKKMLENDAESQAADAIVSHLAKSNVSNGLSKLPQMELDTNSMSGLSILQSEASKQPATSTVNKSSSNSGSSIMARVLEGASKAAKSGTKVTEKEKERSNPPNTMESPRKRPPKTAAFPSTPVPPTTPKQTNFFSMSGTPIGLSPGFRPSPGARIGAGITLTPNGPLSPAPSTMMRFVNDQSVDGLGFACDFHISEESRKELEGQDEPQHDPNPPPLTPSKNSLMFGEHDLEAISALNSLSNSPFRPKKRTAQGDEGRKDEKRSLFAAVVGGIKQKDPKKKLQF